MTRPVRKSEPFDMRSCWDFRDARAGWAGKWMHARSFLFLLAVPEAGSRTVPPDDLIEQARAANRGSRPAIVAVLDDPAFVPRALPGYRRLEPPVIDGSAARSLSASIVQEVCVALDRESSLSAAGKLPLVEGQLGEACGQRRFATYVHLLEEHAERAGIEDGSRPGGTLENFI